MVGLAMPTMLVLPMLSAIGWQTAALRPAAPVATRAGMPRAGFVVPEIPTNPVAFLAPVFALSWGVAIFGPRSFIQSDLVQKGPKLRSIPIEAPKLRGARLTPEALAITQRFQQQYASRELEVLWAALLKCYGTKELALQAARDNPQILNPSYSFCNTMLESRRVLLTMMSEAEALEVMRQNPAVLQCGPTLEPLGPGEIKAFAKLRSVGNVVLPQEIRAGAVVGFCAAVALVVLSSGSGTGTEVPALLAVSDVLRPVLGTVLAGSFLFTAYAAAKSS